MTDTNETECQKVQGGSVAGNVLIFSLSGIYEHQSFWRSAESGILFLDRTALSGTRGYCDESARAALETDLAAHPAGLRFFDSGSYHYLSLLTASQIREPFALVMLDNHPDLQPAAFGGLLSCGGWLYDAVTDLPLLERVYLSGTDPSLLEAASPLPEKIRPVGPEHLLSDLEQEALPLLITLDKDVLLPEDAACDWSQGRLSADAFFALLERLFASHAVLGMDVCGEAAPDAPASDHRKNDRLNARLLDLWRCLRSSLP